MTTLDLLMAIGAAADQRAKADANAAISALAGASFDGIDAADAEKALKAMMARRWFDLALSLGAAIVGAYPAARGIRKRYAQALIERGELARARAELERLLATPGVPANDTYEYIGSIGRTWKQQFVNKERQEGQTDAALLQRAIDVYLDGYTRDTQFNTWPGINAVALLHLTVRRGLVHAKSGERDAIAAAVINAVELTDARQHWDEATLAEAYVALQRWDDAATQLRRYLWKTTADPFSIGSTLRQFEEIWELGAPGHPGSALLTLLRARLLEMEDGSVRLTPQDITAARAAHVAGDYQKVFGSDHYLTLSNYRLGLDRCGPVARIGVDADKGEGTGFLVRGKDLDPRLGDEVLLVTNAHVIDPTLDRASGGLPPDDVRVSFQAMTGVDPARRFSVKEVVWSSPKTALDVTIARLDNPPPLPDAYPIASTLPLKGARVVAIGHPGGGTLSLSMNDNELLDFENPGCRVHYRTPTEGGSSGCPIFNRDWKLVGVHHFGGDAVPRLNGLPGTYQANEGISIRAIREALNAEPALDATAIRRPDSP